MEKKNIIRVIIQIAIGLIIAVGVMTSQGAFAEVYISFGLLVWISTTGVLDIFSFALQKGAHFLIPFSTREANGKFYEFKVEKAKKRKQKGKGQYMTLLVGIGFLMIAIALTVAWYYV